MSSLLGIILGRISFKTTRPAPSMVPSIWTYWFAQSLGEGLLASRATLYTLWSHMHISSCQSPPLSFSQGDSGCRPHEPQTPVDMCQVAPPPKVRRMHPLPHLKVWGTRGHSIPATLSREVSFISGLRWCALTLGPVRLLTTFISFSALVASSKTEEERIQF